MSYPVAYRASRPQQSPGAQRRTPVGPSTRRPIPPNAGRRYIPPARPSEPPLAPGAPPNRDDPVRSPAPQSPGAPAFGRKAAKKAARRLSQKIALNLLRRANPLGRVQDAFDFYNWMAGGNSDPWQQWKPSNPGFSQYFRVCEPDSAYPSRPFFTWTTGTPSTSYGCIPLQAITPNWQPGDPSVNARQFAQWDRRTITPGQYRYILRHVYTRLGGGAFNPSIPIGVPFPLARPQPGITRNPAPAPAPGSPGKPRPRREPRRPPPLPGPRRDPKKNPRRGPGPQPRPAPRRRTVPGRRWSPPKWPLPPFRPQPPFDPFQPPGVLPPQHPPAPSWRRLPYVDPSPDRDDREQRRTGPAPFHHSRPIQTFDPMWTYIWDEIERLTPALRPNPEEQEWLEPPLNRPNPDPAPGPRPVTPTVTQLVNSAGTTRPISRARPSPRRPPGRHTKERKAWIGLSQAKLFASLLGIVTESMDFVTALFWALPKSCRPRGFSDPLRKAQAVLDCWDHIDLKQAMKNIVKMQLEDWVYGQLGKRLAIASERTSMGIGFSSSLNSSLFDNAPGKQSGLMKEGEGLVQLGYVNKIIDNLVDGLFDPPSVRE